MTKEDAVWAAVYAHVWCTWPGANPYVPPTAQQRAERASAEADHAVLVLWRNKEEP